MNIDSLRLELLNIFDKAISSADEYLTFLNVIGKNQNYDLLNQISIYGYDKKSVACATYSQWQEMYGRQVITGSRGIPIIRNEQIDHVFDIKKTIKTDNVNNDFSLWKFEKEKDSKIIENILKENNIASLGTRKDIESLCNLCNNFYIEKLTEQGTFSLLSDGETKSIKEFILKSEVYAVSKRFNLRYEIDDNLLLKNTALLREWDRSFDILNVISNVNKYVIGITMKKSKEDVEIKDKVVYNDENTTLKRESMEDKQDEILWRRGPSEHGGDKVQESDTLISDGGGDGRLRSGKDGGDTGERGISEGTSGHKLDADGARLSIDERGESWQADKAISERRAHALSTGYSKTSREYEQCRDEEDIKGLGSDRGATEGRSEQIQWSTSEHGILGRRDSDEIRNRGIEEKEADKASFLNESDNYWIVEFNEGSNLIEKNYKGELVTKELLDEIKELDEKIRFHNKTVGENEYGELTDDWEGCSKFYFDHYVNEEIVEHLRVDIGEGNEVNEQEFTYLEEQVALSEGKSLQEETQEKIEPKFKIGDEVRYKDKDYTITGFENLSQTSEKLAVKVGEEFILEDENSFDRIKLIETETKVEINGEEFTLYKGETFDESRKIDDLLDSGNYEIYKLSDYEKESSKKEDFESKKEDLKEEKTLKLDQGKSEVKNYKITEQNEVLKLTESERLNYNLEAISMLKRIERGQRELDINVQDVLAKYVGWGGLSSVFDEEKGGSWETARNFLKENLSETEYENIKESSLTAFYTPKEVIDGIYKGLGQMGFKGGRILEPSMGIGNFIGSIPKEMGDSEITGVELDSISGKIAKLLYPESRILIKGFEKSDFEDNYFDLAIGNVPFGDFKVFDRRYDKNNFLIHDYFFAKSIDKVRTGGLIAFITSKGTMEKKNRKIREYINARCDFLGAIRLPNNIFKNSAGTEVTSDIIFLKKREKTYNRENTWLNTDYFNNLNLTCNKYFLENPDKVIGDMIPVSGRFGESLECVLEDKDKFSTLFENAINDISNRAEYIEKEKESTETEKEILPLKDGDDIKNFSYTLKGDDIYFRENHNLIKQDLKANQKNKIKIYLDLVNKLNEVIKIQNDGKGDDILKNAQDELNNSYNNFKIRYGIINDKKNAKDLNIDSNYYLACSLEIIDDKNKFVRKADIFNKRTIKSAVSLESVDTSDEALILSISEKGRVDFTYMESVTDIKRDEIIKDLKGEIFLDTEERYKIDDLINILSNEDSLYFKYVTKSEYLSGNIRDKINNAITLSNDIFYTIERYKENGDARSQAFIEPLEKLQETIRYQIEELRNVLPKELKASEINVRLGASWVPAEDIKDFIFETFDTRFYTRYNIDVRYSSYTSEWNIKGKSEDKGNPLAESRYGSYRVNAYQIIENALNLRDTRVYDKVLGDDGKERSVLNKEETIIAGQKQELLNEEFTKWIFKDKDRRDRLVKIYNEKFNSIRNREYDGKNLMLTGKNTEIELKEHQKNAISRILFGGNTLLAHVVGAGKTFDMVASAMESKRLGLSSKALFVVPNHITGQMGREFMQLYPGANIMVADKRDFEPKNRKKFIGRIATGAYDAVIIGHSQFEKIPMSKEYQENHIRMQIEDITEQISLYRLNRDLRFSVKQLEKTKKKLGIRLEKLLDDDKKDNVITFEELGVDKLYIDEAHYYKNLFLYTKMRNVAGLSQSEAQKSSDLFMKCRYMDEMTGGKGIVFATGTPISNSMTELYTMQRYLQYDLLEERGHQNFDAWVSDFGETTTSFELSPEGTGYRAKTRLSKFHGLPELMSTFKEVADIKTADMINLPVPKANYEVVKTSASDIQKEILENFSKRADDVRDGKVDPSKDNMLKITTDGKKLALDQRLISENLPDDENSKVNKCVEKVYSIWNDTKEKKSTQLIFSDMSTPKGDGSFNIYDDIKAKLINLGVPKDEISFIHDAKTDSAKEKVFQKVKQGEIRVLLGSTAKMGAGTNVQDKLIAIHDLDVPWRPSDLEQRAGRIVRQGNENEEVSIYRYITENTFDSYLWQTIENKQRFISQIMTSKTPVRSIEDIDEVTLNYSEIKSLATGNPLIKEKMELDNDVAKLKMLKASYNENKFALEEKIENIYPKEISKLDDLISGYSEDADKVSSLPTSDEFSGIEILSENIMDKKEAGEKLLKEIRKVQAYAPKKIGKYKGFELEARYDVVFNSHKFYLVGSAKHLGEFGSDPLGNITRLDNVIKNIEKGLSGLLEKKEVLISQLEKMKVEVKAPFEKEDELMKKTLRLSELNSQLLLSKGPEKANFDEKNEVKKERALSI